jgi:aspartate/methionine/tyrosine aminotransferase
MLKERYLCLKDILASSPLSHWKFNSAFFVLLDAPNGAEEARLRLLEHGVGVVSMPSVGAIRLSYSTVPEENLPELISIIEKYI